MSKAGGRLRAFPRELRWHWLAAGLLALAAFLLFMHYDLRETSAHSALFLESIFKGEPRSFYGLVAGRQNPYDYVNNANYNPAMYSVFALAELPVYLVYRALGSLPPQALLGFVAKAVCAAFYAGCVMLMPVLARQAGLSQKDAGYAALLFALWPPAFFSTFVMGQYDVICLFLMLAGFLCWTQGWMLPFAFFFGAAFAAKSFPALLFLPLLLLREKRPTRLLLYGVVSLWLLLPTGLLYRGLTLGAADFNALMAARLFATRLSGGREIPLFAVLFGLLCAACWFWRPKKERLVQSGLWLGLAVFGLLFLLAEWHPQWLILLAPFAVLTTLLEKRRMPWLCADILLCLGFFLVTAAAFPAQAEANMLQFGLPGLAFGYVFGGTGMMQRLVALWPLAAHLPMAVFGAGLLAQLVLKFPLSGGSPASRLAGEAAFPGVLGRQSLGFYAWVLFLAGFGLCWLAPMLLTLM